MESMTNEQLYLAIGVPSVINIGLMVLLCTVLSAKIDSLRNEINAGFKAVDARFEAAHHALLRVEGVFDTRLKHLEQSR